VCAGIAFVRSGTCFLRYLLNYKRPRRVRVLVRILVVVVVVVDDDEPPDDEVVLLVVVLLLLPPSKAANSSSCFFFNISNSSSCFFVKAALSICEREIVSVRVGV